MQYSLIDVLTLTIFSMTAVFFVLLGLMLLMMLSAKIFKEKETEQPSVAAPLILSNQVLFQADPLAKVAAIVVLAQASEENDGKTFKIKQIEKMN